MSQKTIFAPISVIADISSIVKIVMNNHLTLAFA
jgi:hypothetical protein